MTVVISSIIALAADNNDEYILLGNTIGNIVVYKIDRDVHKWKHVKYIRDQRREISHLNVNGDLNLWVSASVDGFVNLYTLPLCKLVRTIKLDTQKCSYSIISSSPLASIVIINEKDKMSELNVYSINGKFITKQQLFTRIINPAILRDASTNEYLAYIGDENITIHCLPTLEILSTVTLLPKMGLTFIFPSDDNYFLYCVTKNGMKLYGIENSKFEIVKQ